MFLSEALQVIMDPQHILYEKVNVFFLQRPSLDLDDIPMAYALSNTGEYFAKEVDWLLDILIAGLDDKQVPLLGPSLPYIFCKFLRVVVCVGV